ncbi:MAG: plasmid partitioning protein RepB C-terminal domain-containing protein [Verrucomicrobiota bacterium]
MKKEVKMIPIDQIRIINPRHRDKGKFEQLVQSIKNLGLKKPIQVNLRSVKNGEDAGYDLICGQGRIEAFKVLGFTEIPAEVVEIPKDERLLRSLVENMARRFPPAIQLIREIERLKSLGHNNSAIAAKLDVPINMVGGYLSLSKAGEERLLDAAIRGAIPLGVAMDIAKAESHEMQKELLKAYETKELNQASIRLVKRLIQQRQLFGKGVRNPAERRRNTSADSLVNTYKRESQKQKMLIRKAQICDSKLLFIVTAFKKLLADENFVTLLRAEGLASMPQFLSDKINATLKEAA